MRMSLANWRTPRRSRPGWVLVLRAILARLGAAHCQGVARRRWGLGTRDWGDGGSKSPKESMPPLGRNRHTPR